MEKKMPNVVIISGEGELGQVTRYTGKDTTNAIRTHLTQERCGGDRWARAYRYWRECVGGSAYAEIDGSDVLLLDHCDITDAKNIAYLVLR